MNVYIVKKTLVTHKILMKHLFQIIIIGIVQQEREELAQFCRQESHVNEESERAGAQQIEREEMVTMGILENSASITFLLL